MAIQKLTALEKTSIQLRHTLKRLEVFAELARTDEEVILAKGMIAKLEEVRMLIPPESQDVDLKEKE